MRFSFASSLVLGLLLTVAQSAPISSTLDHGLTTFPSGVEMKASLSPNDVILSPSMSHRRNTHLVVRALAPDDDETNDTGGRLNDGGDDSGSSRGRTQASDSSDDVGTSRGRGGGGGGLVGNVENAFKVSQRAG